MEMMLLGWMAVPVLAYGGARLAIGRAKQMRAGLPMVDPERRLEELRCRMADGDRAPRGRMAEAVRLAESVGPTASLRVWHP